MESLPPEEKEEKLRTMDLPAWYRLTWLIGFIIFGTFVIGLWLDFIPESWKFPWFITFFVVFASVSTGFSASIDFGKITFTRENNGGDKTWTVLNFTVADPTIDGKRYLDRRSIRFTLDTDRTNRYVRTDIPLNDRFLLRKKWFKTGKLNSCLLYTSPSPRDRTRSRMPSSA